MAQDAHDDLRITDQFDFEAFWAEYGKRITWAAVVIGAIALVALYWQHQTIQQAELAADSLDRAMDATSLEQVAHNFPTSPVAADALFRLGDLYYGNGKYTEAASAYERIAKDFPSHPLADSAKLSLAAISEAEGKLDDAKTQYSQIVNSGPTSYVASAARMGLGRCLEMLGQKKEARQVYEELLAAGQSSPWFTQAYIRWVVLNRDMPPEKTETSSTLKPATAPSTGGLQLPSLPATP
jgi:tetratricopeptide (TPR) repeat protein